MNKSQEHIEQSNQREQVRSPILIGQGQGNFKKDRNMKSLAHLSQILTNNHQSKSPRNFPSLSSLNNQFERTHNFSNNASLNSFKQPIIRTSSQKPFTSSQNHRLNKSQLQINEFNRINQNSSSHNSSQYLQQSEISYKQVLNEFLRVSSYSERMEKDLVSLQASIKEVLQCNERLESENRSLKKDLQRHTKMLEFSQISNKQKDAFFQQMVEQNIHLKNELDELKFHKTQLQQIEIIKDMKQPIVIASPQRKRNTQIIQNQNQIQNTASISNIQKPVLKNESQQLQKQKSQMWQQMKQVLEDHNIINTNSSSSTFIPNNENQQINQSSSKSKRNILISTSNLQNGTQNAQPTSNTFNTPLSSYNSKLSKLFKNSRQQVGIFNQDSAEKKNLRPLFIQHSTDHAFYASALDMDMGDGDIKDFYLEGKYIKFLKGHFSDESNLQKLIYNLEGQTFKYFYESVNSLLSNLSIGMNLILKMKQVIKCIYNLQHKMNIAEVFDALSNESIKIFNCDKASIYLLDEKSNLFWAKGNKNEMIKIPIDQCNENIKFFSFSSIIFQSVPVLENKLYDFKKKLDFVVMQQNAQLDDRFDKQIDVKNNYRTKSVLCAPIFDTKSNRVMGVLQVVNKENQSFFTKDDEGILKVISLLSENILKNSVFNDERAEFYNSLRSLYSYSIDAIKCSSLQELVETSQTFLHRNLNIPLSKIVLFDKEIKKFYTYQGGQRINYDTTEGIIGKVFISQKLLTDSNISENIDFNKMIDIETQLPVVTIPIIKATYLQKDKSLVPFSVDDFVHYEAECSGVLQVINSRGIHTLLIQTEKESKSRLTSYETLQRFCKLFSSALLKFC